MFINRTDPIAVRDPAKTPRKRRNDNGEFGEALESVMPVEVVHLDTDHERNQRQNQKNTQKQTKDKSSEKAANSGLNIKV